MATDSRMVALGFGKFARADRIFALERITGEERGDGRRTRELEEVLDLAARLVVAADAGRVDLSDLSSPPGGRSRTVGWHGSRMDGSRGAR